MSKARNHVTQIQAGEHLAKDVSGVKEQVKAEVANAEDPVDAHKRLLENEKHSPLVDTANAVFTQELAKPENKDKKYANPNTKLDTEEKRVASGGESSEEAGKDADKKSKQEEGVSDLQVTEPKLSQAAGGVDTTHKPQPKHGEDEKKEKEKSEKQKKELEKGLKDKDTNEKK